MISKYLSRSFWLAIYVITASLALDWFKDKNSFVVVVPAFLTGWFGMKVVERLKNGNGRPKPE